jgi:nitrogen fixation protein FixH
MNWGKGILITIIIFIAGTVVMMVIAMNSPSDLVMKNYYEKGVRYQEQIDKINRTNMLPEKVNIEFTGSTVLIKIPSTFEPEKINGEVLFYRPSDEKEDVRFPLSIDTSYIMIISTDKLEKGFWKVQLSWGTDEADYFNEASFTIK